MLIGTPFEIRLESDWYSKGDIMLVGMDSEERKYELKVLSEPKRKYYWYEKPLVWIGLKFLVRKRMTYKVQHMK